MKKLLITASSVLILAGGGTALAGQNNDEHNCYQSEVKTSVSSEDNNCHMHKDVCINIDGKQKVVPEGYTVNSDKVCTLIPVEQPPVVTPVTPTPTPTPAAVAPATVVSGGEVFTGK